MSRIPALPLLALSAVKWTARTTRDIIPSAAALMVPLRRSMIRGNNRIISGFLSALCCCIVICACSTGLVFALDPSRLLNQFGHDIWQREQGLPNNTIRAILQTHDGYLWLATEEGLVRFDGVRFKVFDTQNTREIASNQIQLLFEDKKG